jgi:hypothetical protein
MSDEKKTAFEEAGKQAERGLVAEFIQMLKENKKYWMVPLILVLLGFGALIILSGGSVIAPFIYTIF